MLLLLSLADGLSMGQASGAGSFLTQSSIMPCAVFTCVPCSIVSAVQASYLIYAVDEEMELPTCETACPSLYFEQVVEL